MIRDAFPLTLDDGSVVTADEMPCQDLLRELTYESARAHVSRCGTCREFETAVEADGPNDAILTVTIVRVIAQTDPHNPPHRDGV